MPILLFLFGAIDIIAAIMLWQSGWFGPSWTQLVGWVVLVKGLYSIGTSYLNKFYFDFLGWADVAVAGIILAGWAIPFFWAVPLIKGGWTMLSVYANRLTGQS
ncbi:MAG: hypothetical protein HYS81_03215 [Candidatus Aenigmatarchaeota archaeon]|nr:MAG: hypothetical protein HYS81_03215 [Candidatus Aenigmarchaeota archaeon]